MANGPGENGFFTSAPTKERRTINTRQNANDPPWSRLALPTKPPVVMGQSVTEQDECKYAY